MHQGELELESERCRPKTRETSVKCTKMKMSCMRGVCWRRARTSNGKKSSSKKSKLKLKKLAHESLLSVENNSCASPRKVVEVKDIRENTRATMDTGAAGYVMPAEMFPRVKLDRTNATKKFVAATGERIKDLGEKTIPFKSVEGVHRFTKFRSANVAKPLVSMRKVAQAGQCRGPDEKNPHIRSNRDGSVIKLDVNNGVYTMDMWVCLDETCSVFSWQGQWLECHKQTCKTKDEVQQ